MNKLIWKELREMRLIPIAIAVLVAITLLTCYTISTWIASHGGDLSVRLSPSDCGAFLLFGIALSGVFAGSGAIAPEIGSGTLAFLTSLPIGRPRLWTAKVIAGVIIMVASAVLVTLAYLAATYCLFPEGSATKSIFAVAGILQMSALAAYMYCIALLVSTLVDRTITAAVVAVIASMAVGYGLGLFFSVIDQHDPMTPFTGAAVYGWVFVAMLCTSFTAFCRGDSLRTRRRLTIAAVTLLAWLTVGGVAFAAYGQHCQDQYDRQVRQAALDRSKVIYGLEEAHPFSISAMNIPFAHSRHWYLHISDAFIGETCHADIDMSASDLNMPGARPVRAACDSKAVTATVGPPGRFPREFYRGGPSVRVVDSRGRYFAGRITAEPTVATVRIVYTPRPPAGPEHEIVYLYDSRGHVVGAIDVVGFRVERQAFPTATGFEVQQ